MTTERRVYTSGDWIVKPGEEAEFVRLWEAFTGWSPEFQEGLSRCRQRCDDFRGGDFAEAARVVRTVEEGVRI